MTTETTHREGEFNTVGSGARIQFEHLNEPGTYVCLWSGHMLRVPEDAIKPGHSPVLGITSAFVFIMKAGILSGEFYFHAAALLATALVMAVLQRYGYQFGLTLFGVVSAATFFLPGLKYYRQRSTNRAEAPSILSGRY